MKKNKLIDTLPDNKFKELVLYESESNQVDSDMVIMNFLGAINAVTNGKFEIVRPSGLSQPNNLYLIIVGGSGERKSEIVKRAKEPFNKILMEKNKKLNVVKFFNDITKAGLTILLKKSNGRGSCFEAEPELILKLIDKAFDVILFNNGYDGETYIVHRGNKEETYIYDTTITICVSCQPDLAMEFLRNKRLRDKGLHGRFLYIKMESMAGYRKIHTPPVPRESTEWYENKISSLNNICPEKDSEGAIKRFKLSLSAGANKAYLDFSEKAEFELRPGGALSFDKSWGGKLPHKVLRIAENLHCINEDQPIGTDISIQTMEQAIEMAYVFTIHARQLYFDAEYKKDEDCSKDILSWALMYCQLRSFTAADAKSGIAKYPLKQIKQGIDYLLKAGKLTIDYRAYYNTIQSGKKGRIPAEKYILTNNNFNMNQGQQMLISN